MIADNMHNINKRQQANFFLLEQQALVVFSYFLLSRSIVRDVVVG
jgi:hypothetical protein